MIFVDMLRENSDLSLCDSKFISHLFTDGDENELHEFAFNILALTDKKWYDEREGHKHYDINEDERNVALNNGAIFKPPICHKKNWDEGCSFADSSITEADCEECKCYF